MTADAPTRWTEEPTNDNDAPISTLSPRGEPMIVAGKYRLVRTLALTGMSTVYFAEHLGLSTPVALKMLLGDCLAHPDAIPRFEQEARLLAKVARVSDHVVRPIDAGVDEGHHYLVMEHLEGATLGELIASGGPLPAADAAEVVTQTARGVGAAHGLGIIHRDIKPDNVFLCVRDGVRRAKLLDLGIAKQLDARRIAQTTQPAGTAASMAPEQWIGAAVDERTDTWALGVLAYTLLTGRAPFEAASLGAIHRLVCGSDDPPPSLIRRPLDAFFARALARSPDDRFASADALARAFEAAALG